MAPKKTPFTDAYSKNQQSLLHLGSYFLIGSGGGLLGVAISNMISRSSRAEAIYFEIICGLILIAWGGLTRQRLQTYLENREIYKAIHQSREAEKADR